MTSRTTRSDRRPHVVRLLAVLAVVALGAVLMTSTSNAKGDVSLAAVPRADCGPGSRPETSIQGRVPAHDYATGRARVCLLRLDVALPHRRAVQRRP
jgi:hypothetical protein